jgi:hypothetical protein
MATSCSIRIEEIDYVEVYKHWDGYPENMLPWLKRFHRDFLKHRGWDPEYEIAQLLKFATRHHRKYQLDNDKYTGWGLIPFDADYGQNYIYTLKKDGSITY